ncbi:MAG TPA: hypothetical protein VFC85_00970 [Verrucomicrobiae bacterium]|nr:hypothetical protein [Verrucomicrobiae bacterium]
MLAAGIKTPVPLEELENHLREEIEQQMKSGQNEQPAFEIALAQIGQAKPLKMEFKKIDKENWNRPLAWSAWILFVISFFLPAAYDDMWGWQCAWISAGGFFSSEFWHGKLGSGDFHLTLLTFANLLMIASPFLLVRFSQNLRFVKFWRVFSFLTLVLVWSFIFRLIMNDGVKSLKIGCYVWTASFLLLGLSTLKIRRRKAQIATN